MNISDIIALAKAGYKPADIREFMQQTIPDPQPAPAEDPQPGQEPEPSKDQPAESQGDAGAPDKYKTQLDQLVAENKKLMDQLHTLQEANSRAAQAAKETKTDQDILNDLVQSFM